MTMTNSIMNIKLNIFDLERNGPIPFEEWHAHSKNLPVGVWNFILNNIEERFSTMLGYRDDTGYYVLCSGQGPFVMWMEKSQPVNGPYPFNPKPGEKRYDYENVKLEKKYLEDNEWNAIDNE
jgi:hypothetical protein